LPLPDLVAIVRCLIASLRVVEDDVSARLACLATLSIPSTNLEHVRAMATSSAMCAMIALSLDDMM
jgi:hypothetical protein